MESSGSIKNLTVIVVILLHAILLISLSFMVFKAVSKLTNKRGSSSAPVSFNDSQPKEDLQKPTDIFQSKDIAVPEEVASNIKSEDKQPDEIYSGVKEEIKPDLIKPIEIQEENIPEVQENIIPEQPKIQERDIIQKPSLPIVSNAKSSTVSNSNVSSRPKMSGKDFLKKAVSVYDNYRYKAATREQNIDNYGDDSKSRHMRVLQERVAYWNDFAYIDAIDDAIVDEANKYRDYYVYSAEDLNEIYDIEFSVASDGSLHSIDVLTGIKEVDDHLTRIIKKAKYPVNKKCKIYKYKTKIRVNLNKGLNPVKITKPRYWN